MGSISSHPPVLPILAATSSDEATLEWARDQVIRHWGPVALASDAFAFVETDYYRATMGPDLRKQFFAIEQLIDPARLASMKCQTNAWEEAYSQLGTSSYPRPINLDPGYLTEAKLVLASTKDHSHRIYLNKGIYGEITLYYRDHCWQQHDWTYPDYRRHDYQQFFDQCRSYLRERLHS